MKDLLISVSAFAVLLLLSVSVVGQKPESSDVDSLRDFTKQWSGQILAAN